MANSFVLQAQPFCGRIVYSTKVAITDSTYLFSDYQQAKYGDSLIIHLDSLGSIRKDYVGAGNPGFEFSILNPESEFSVHKFTYSDSLYLSDNSLEPSILLRIDTLGQEEILDRKCDVFKLLLFIPQDGAFFTITLWLSAEIRLNHQAFRNWKEGHWDTISGLNSGMYLKWVTTHPFMTVSFEAVRMENMVPDKSLFKYDTNIATIMD
jgi:hypothetical protein